MIGYGAAGLVGVQPHNLVINVVTRYMGLGPGGIAAAERDFARLGRAATVADEEVLARQVVMQRKADAVHAAATRSAISQGLPANLMPMRRKVTDAEAAAAVQTERNMARAKRAFLNFGVGVGLVAGGTLYHVTKMGIAYQQLSQQLRAQSTFMRGEFASMIKFSQNWAMQTGAHVETVMQAYRRVTDVGFHGARAREFVRQATMLGMGTGTDPLEATFALIREQKAFHLRPTNANIAYLARETHVATQLSNVTLAQFIQQLPRISPIAGLIGGKRGVIDATAMLAALSRVMPVQQAGAAAMQTIRAFEQPTQSMRRAMTEILVHSGGAINLFKYTGQRGIRRYGAEGILNELARAHLNQSELQTLFPNIRQEQGIFTLLGGTRRDFSSIVRIMGMSPAGQIAHGVQTPQQSYRQYLGTAAGQLNVLRANFHQLGITVGTEVVPSLTALLKQLNPLLHGLNIWMSSNDKIIGSHGKLVAKLLIGATAIGAMAVAVRGAFMVAAVATDVWTAAVWLWNAAVDANPIGLLIVGVAALTAGIIYAYNNWKPFRVFVQAAMKDLSRFASAVLPQVGHAIGGMIKALGTVITWVSHNWKTLIVILGGPLVWLVAAVIKWGPSLMKVVSNAISPVITWISKKWHGLTGVIGGVMNNIAKAITNASHRIWSASLGIGAAIIGGIKHFWDTHNPVSWITGKLNDLTGPVKALFGMGGAGAAIGLGAAGPLGGAPGAALFGLRGATSETAGPLSHAGVARAYGHTDVQVAANTPFRLPPGQYALVTKQMHPGWGETLTFSTPGGGQLTFMHMDTMNKALKVGQTYKGGTYLGMTGGVPGQAPGVTSAYSTGAHLHVGYNKAAYQYLFASSHGRGFVSGPVSSAYGEPSFAAYGKNPPLPAALIPLLPAIQAASARYNIPVPVIAALIQQESSGNVNVASTYNQYENAMDIGLMQFGPAEAKLAGGKYTRQAAGNIMTGTGYFAYLLRNKARGNVQLAIAMYNAGPGVGTANTKYQQSVSRYAAAYGYGMGGVGGAPNPGGAPTPNTGYPPRPQGYKGKWPPEGMEPNRAIKLQAPRHVHYPGEIYWVGNKQYLERGGYYDAHNQFHQLAPVQIYGPGMPLKEGQIVITAAGKEEVYHAAHGNVRAGLVAVPPAPGTIQFTAAGVEQIYHGKYTDRSGNVHRGGYVTVGAAKPKPGDLRRHGGYVEVYMAARTDNGITIPKGWYPQAYQRIVTMAGIEQVYLPPHTDVMGRQAPAGFYPVAYQQRVVGFGAKQRVEVYIPEHVVMVGGQRVVHPGAFQTLQTPYQRWLAGAKQRAARITQQDIFYGDVQAGLRKAYPATPTVNLTPREAQQWLKGQQQIVTLGYQLQMDKYRRQYTLGQLTTPQYRQLTGLARQGEIAAMQKLTSKLTDYQLGGPETGVYRAYHIVRRDQCAAEEAANKMRHKSSTHLQHVQHNTEHANTILRQIAADMHHQTQLLTTQHKQAHTAHPTKGQAPHIPKDPRVFGHQIAPRPV